MHAKPRFNAVFIRKSTLGQDERGQIHNVKTMLANIGISIPEEHWFAGTVSRRKVKSNPEFARLMELVNDDQVSTVFVESQDRWGTADRSELFSLLGTLREHDTRLFDLRANKDLTERDLATEMLAFIGSIKSEKELQDTLYRSLRTRVNNFKVTGSWPTGPHPFGYAKACFASDGTLLWVWQPISRSRGQVHYPDATGGMRPGPESIQIPRKAITDKIKLVPSNNKAFVEAVRAVFDMYTRVGLSRRQISARLNASEHRFYDRQFSHSFVTQILSNPAYAGDIHFGKTQTGELNTFNGEGVVVELKRPLGNRNRPVRDRLIVENAHEPLVDRKTWSLAQSKLEAERARTCYAPRNPAYFLKQLFVCGHCGKNLTGRTEVDHKSKKRTVVYVCSTYVQGRCNGHPVPCGYQRITHEEAEQLLRDKIAEQNLAYDEATSDPARTNLKARLSLLGREDEADAERWQRVFMEGIDALAKYFAEAYDFADYRVFQRLRRQISAHYLQEETYFTRLPFDAKEFCEAVQEVEQRAARQADDLLRRLTEDYRAYTLNWAKATPEMQAILKEEIERVESKIIETKSRTVPVAERLRALYASENERRSERARLLAEWPALEAGEKGEAMRRLFTQVTLFWDRQFCPALPGTKRKTERPGRNRYTLLRDKIVWQLTSANLGGSR